MRRIELPSSLLDRQPSLQATPRAFRKQQGSNLQGVFQLTRFRGEPRRQLSGCASSNFVRSVYRVGGTRTLYLLTANQMFSQVNYNPLSLRSTSDLVAASISGLLRFFFHQERKDLKRCVFCVRPELYQSAIISSLYFIGILRLLQYCG